MACLTMNDFSGGQTCTWGEGRRKPIGVSLSARLPARQVSCRLVTIDKEGAEYRGTQKEEI